MSHYNAVLVLLEATGAPEAVAGFVAQHLAQRSFTFETLLPIPPGLEHGVPSDVEDAHDALFGDWTKVAGRHRFIEVAAARGFPFPLQSREQAIACHEALAPYGPEALGRARRYEDNVLRHGAGEVSAWCKKHRGVDTDAERTIAEIESAKVTVAFELGGAPADKLLKRYATAHPALAFDVGHVTGTGQRPKRVAFRAGRKPAAIDAAPAADLHASIVAFRRRCGLPWLARFAPAALVERTVTMDAQGHHFLRDNGISLDFALARLHAGEAPEHLRTRFPDITGDQARLLVELDAADRWRATGRQVPAE